MFKDSFGNLTSNVVILHTAQVFLIVYFAETVNSFCHPHDTIKILKTKKLSRSLYNSILRILVLELEICFFPCVLIFEGSTHNFWNF